MWSDQTQTVDPWNQGDNPWESLLNMLIELHFYHDVVIQWSLMLIERGLLKGEELHKSSLVLQEVVEILGRKG